MPRKAGTDITTERLRKDEARACNAVVTHGRRVYWLMIREGQEGLDRIAKLEDVQAKRIANEGGRS